jgi:L-serine/L-threonine ammonia-lyase
VPLHQVTPLLHARALSQRSGSEVLLKLDLLQPSGSFKLRGVGHACEHYAAAGAKHFVSSSGGNAGIAVAYAGRRLGIPVTVVVPESTTHRAIERIQLEDADVVVHGESWAEANAHAQGLISAQSAFIHPFDDPLLWAGHATLIDEVVAAGAEFDAVVVAVGGGGLLCGVIEGLERHGLTNTPVVAVETHGADALGQSLRAGERITLPAITSIATSLGAKQVAARAFELAQLRAVEAHSVSDRAALEASLRFLDEHQLLVEPACAAALALLERPERPLERFPTTLVVVCGGVTATLAQQQSWLEARSGNP